MAEEHKTSDYQKEIRDVLQKIKDRIPSQVDAEYFFENVRKHYLMEYQNPAIVVIGSNIPGELVYASNEAPYWILGGSRISSQWADDAVPRDTDPVSRSSLGYLKSGFAEHALFLFPLVNDSSRKLAYLLKATGYHIHPFHFPPIKDADSFAEWNRQYESCRMAISLHLKRPLTKRALQKAAKQIQQANHQLKNFMDTSEGVLDGSMRMFLRNSYYCTENLSECGVRIQHLTEQVSKLKKENSEKRNVLLLGSPIYFPNYKVPFLIEETGLYLLEQMDYTTQSIANEGCYQQDISPAYVKNDAFYEQVSKTISEQEIHGVVYHVLKGQIEYDFELGRLEELFERWDIPVFLLETDYNYQDIKQLRIRLEAFSEVLHQRKYRSGVTV